MVLAVEWNDRKFMSEMNNLIEYSIGFIDGIDRGKPAFLNSLGKATIESLKDFIDSMARVDQRMLHHVYEWNRVGDPSSRLFNLDYSLSNGGLSIGATFTQSKIASQGSTEPFYDKARIMELGIPVTIKPKKNVLAFKDGENTVFTKRPITINNPGGEESQHGLETTLDTFFNRYFSQLFLDKSGILKYLETPAMYHKYLQGGIKGGGRSAGLSAGYRWISQAGADK